jgi:hypothetical protein
MRDHIEEVKRQMLLIAERLGEALYIICRCLPFLNFKLTKADAGKVVNLMNDEEILVYVFGKGRADLSNAISSQAKLTKADAGRAIDATLDLMRKH